MERAVEPGASPPEREPMDARTLHREVERLHAQSFGWALACCGWRRPEAEDALQTAYLKVLEGQARWEGRASLKTWLFAVIRRTAAEARRRRWLERVLLRRPAATGAGAAEGPPPAEPAHLLEAHRRARRVQTALAALPARQREVLDLVFYHGLTIEEAAQVMGVSLGSARVHYQRGKARLSARLGAERA